jgi:hypothetical protein
MWNVYRHPELLPGDLADMIQRVTEDGAPPPTGWD